MKHELWAESNGEQTFCLAGPHGDSVRALLSPGAIMVWETEAESHFEAMTQYWARMGWGPYTTDFPEQDRLTYRELGLE